VRFSVFAGCVVLVPVLSSAFACHKRMTYYEGPSIKGFRFEAHATVVSPDTLRVTATATNVSQTALQEEHASGCEMLNPLSVVLTSGAKKWDSQKWEISRIPAYKSSEIQRVCAGGVLSTSIPPGATVNYAVSVPFREILGDSLTNGEYDVRAKITINGREINNLKAGRVTISRPAT
jgi:hypothetical protein